MEYLKIWKHCKQKAEDIGKCRFKLPERQEEYDKFIREETLFLYKQYTYSARKEIYGL